MVEGSINARTSVNGRVAPGARGIAGPLPALALVCAAGVAVPPPAAAAAMPAPAACQALQARYPQFKGKTLVDAVNPHTPGYEALDPQDPSKYIGFDIDLAETIGGCLGFTLTYKPVTFAALLTTLSSGQADIVISDIYATEERHDILRNVRVPAWLHFGTMGLAPSESDVVSSIPPSYTGGNIDDWRIGKGARMYYPVAVDGAFFSVGDPHAAQGDSELGGTAIETSLTGDFAFVLHKKRDLGGTVLEGLTHPMLETADSWSVYGFTFPNYLAELGPDAQTTVASHASLDRAMRDAFRKLRRFLMTVHGLSEDEAIALLSVVADFGVTQVVDANWGVHGSIRKSVFTCTPA